MLIVQVWSGLPGLAFLTDAGDWHKPEYCSTIRLCADDGKLVLYGRGREVAHIAVFDTVASAWREVPGPASFTDAGGWGVAKYYSTLRMVVRGGRVTLVGRGAAGLHTASLSL